MSYSFSVRAATKPEVLGKIAAELDKVVIAQPIHAADRTDAQEAALAFLNILSASADQDFHVSVSGSVSWNGTLGAPDQTLTSAGVSVSAALIAKEKS